MNPNYTKFMLVFRGFFLVILSASFITFIRKHRRIIYSFEQKLVLVIAAFSILFNDPYFFIYVFKPSLFLLFLSTTFLAAFLVALIISWICMLQKIKSVSKASIYMPSRNQKMLFGCIGALYFLILAYFQFEVSYYSYTESPIVPVHTSFYNLYLLTLAVTLIVFMYIAWLFLSIAKEWNNVLWRDKIYVTFNLFFVLSQLSTMNLSSA